MSAQTFSIDTNLKETVSPLSPGFIDDYLMRRGGGRLSGIGDAVLAAAAKHGVNATYIAAHAALETGWGTARIAREKNNLFGWSAFDDSPYASARAFPSRDACIDFVIGRIDALYLRPSGPYFVKTPCLGRKGSDGYGMNVHYATDPQWGAKIARIARALERAWHNHRKTMVSSAPSG